MNEDYGLEESDAELAASHPDAANEYHESAGNQDSLNDGTLHKPAPLESEHTITHHMTPMPISLRHPLLLSLMKSQERVALRESETSHKD